MASHMERTKAKLKEDDIIHRVVERYHPRSKKYPFGCKEDFLNIIDLIALDCGVVGIQVCGSDYKSHVVKLRDTEKANSIAWLSQPGTKLQIWSWRKYLKKRGGKAKVWKAMIADALLINNEIYIEERWKRGTTNDLKHAMKQTDMP